MNGAMLACPHTRPGERREARFHTETDRLDAIALYLQVGFEPLVGGDPDRAAWEQVIRFLRANDCIERACMPVLERPFG
jgi:hypothetical protein